MSDAHVVIFFVALLTGSLLLLMLLSPKAMIGFAIRLMAFAEGLEILQHELRALRNRAAVWFSERQEKLRELHGVQRNMVRVEREA